MTEPRFQKNRPDLRDTSLRPETGQKLMPVVSAAAAFIALSTLGLEIWTEQRMNKAAEIPFFLSAPLALGATVVFVIALRGPKNHWLIYPGLMVFTYWVLFFAFV
jgi:hypothetical protein